MEAYFYDYQGQVQVQKEAAAVVAKYPGLKVGRGQVQTRDGSIKNLAHLQGTIPVVYKGNTYNIPICISLMISHPHQPPICYVRPTSTMTIMQSQMVDQTGKIYLKYLQNWKSNNDLLSLIKIMRSKFGETPPVTSVTKGPETTMPYPAYPGYPKPAETNNMPPYPTASFMMDPGMQNMLPYPTEPSYNFPFPSYPQQQPQSSLPYPTNNNPYSIPTPTYPQPYPPPPTNNDTNASNTITEEHIKASLLSAVEDKLKRRLKEFISQYTAEIETLKKTKQELHEGSTRLDSLLSGLNSDHSELEKNIAIMKEKEEEIEKRITQYSDHEIDPDEAVVTTAPLYSQLLNAYAEESTTEDAIYYMGEALRMGVIDLDVFLKQVRALSRKQFTLRALMQKCRQKAGLAY